MCAACRCTSPCMLAYSWAELRRLCHPDWNIVCRDKHSIRGRAQYSHRAACGSEDRLVLRSGIVSGHTTCAFTSPTTILTDSMTKSTHWNPYTAHRSDRVPLVRCFVGMSAAAYSRQDAQVLSVDRVAFGGSHLSCKADVSLQHSLQRRLNSTTNSRRSTVLHVFKVNITYLFADHHPVLTRPHPVVAIAFAILQSSQQFSSPSIWLCLAQSSGFLGPREPVPQ